MHRRERACAVDVDSLFRRAQAGDDAAWAELVDLCAPKVLRVVRRKLNRPMRVIYDSYDFLGDVVTSLVANKDRLQFESLDQLYSFLIKEAEYKVIDEYRRETTQKRDIKRRCSLYGRNHAGEEAQMELAASDPTASEVAQAGEVEEEINRGRSDVEKKAIRLKKQGYSPTEISESIGWHPRKVQRFFKMLSDRFTRSAC